ncbi:phosphatidylethanolamine-binding protein [Pyrenochaeta sp. MPI-SDFR-AT-0127]|nr:phosphatidylethanolamine-binding protein [Pyrenochaeta sp. MPI-SDFR-AT-0127]
MLGNTILSFGALLAATATAQTAPGFPIQASAQLSVAYGNNTVSPPGERIPRGETAQLPNISTPVWSSGTSGPQQGVLLVVDLDVPRNNTRVQLLHWLATNVTLAGTNQGPLNIPNAPVPYLQPSPPVGDVPHSYTFVLFAQPANFSIPAQYSNLTANRVFFNTSQFVKDTGLGPALAANYITVQNLTGTATATFPPGRPTATGGTNGSTPIPFPGAASSLEVGGKAIWAGLATAVLAGVAAFAL